MTDGKSRRLDGLTKSGVSETCPLKETKEKVTVVEETAKGEYQVKFAEEVLRSRFCKMYAERTIRIVVYEL